MIVGKTPNQVLTGRDFSTLDKFGTLVSALRPGPFYLEITNQKLKAKKMQNR